MKASAIVMNKFVFASISVIVFFVAKGQPSGYKIKLSQTEMIKAFNPSSPIVEPHLAVSPTNANHMIAVAIVFDSAATSEIRTHIAVFTTKNNGKDWKQTDLPMTVGFDPWVAVRDDRDAVVIALAGYTNSHFTNL